MINRNIPSWCKYHKNLQKDNNKYCCYCGDNVVHYQRGDGKVLHSLCYNCFFDRLKLNKTELKVCIQ